MWGSHYIGIVPLELCHWNVLSTSALPLRKFLSGNLPFKLSHFSMGILPLLCPLELE